MNGDKQAPGRATNHVDRPRLLVVENSDEFREALVIWLQDAGFDVESCSDAEQAFYVVERERPALVVSELMLGATNGLDLITRVRSELAAPFPRILAYSGFAEFERAAMQRGADAFVPKPFDAVTLLGTVRSLLTRGEIAEHERAAARVHAQGLRAEAIEASRAATRRLAPRWEDLTRRARWTAEFIPRYFGFGEAFWSIIEGDALTVAASSNERVWRRGMPLDLALCRDIVETRSALVIPDVSLLGARLRAPDGKEMHFFAGVPSSNEEVTVGAICFVDPDPRRFGSDGFSVLESLGRRATALLSARESDVGPAWTSSGLLSRTALGWLIASELSRMDHEGLFLSLFVFARDEPGMQVHERSAIAEIGPRRFAALFTRASEAEARNAVLDFLSQTAHAPDFDGGGLISIERGGETFIGAHELLHGGERLLDRALRDGGIERVVIRRDPIRLGDAAPP